jgi:PST family polysaccharide transporter
VLAITVALIGPFAVPGAQLQRDFRQDVLFRATVVSFMVSNALLILMAANGNGAMAFAWSRVVGQVVIGILMVRSLKRVFRPGFKPGLLRPLMRFGLPLAAANLLSQALLNIDYVFVGRMMSTEEVGVYMMAFNICMWSSAVIGSILNGMVLPTFSSVSRDHGDMAQAVERGLGIVAVFACPIAAFTLAFAGPLVTTLYGTRWSAAGGVLSVLSFYGVAFVFGLLFANILIAVGKTGPLFMVQAVALVCLLPALWAGISWGGLIGIGVAHVAVVTVVTLPVYIASLCRSTGVRLIGLVRAVRRPGLASIGAAVVATAVTIAVPSDVMRLLLGAFVGGAVYLCGSWRDLAPLLPAKLTSFIPNARVASGVDRSQP